MNYCVLRMEAMNYQILKSIFLSIALLGTSLPLAAVEKGGAMPACIISPISTDKNTALEQYKGKVVYVDFWASWCAPCAKSFPFLNELHQQLQAKGLAIVAVNLDEKPEDANAFLAKYPANFTVVADASKQCAKDFDVKAMPSSYLIDRKGIVRHIQLGFKPGEAQDLQKLVEQLLLEQPSS